MVYFIYSDTLTHHGIKGQRWGIRRYQNSDGTLTESGKKRYSRDVRENLAKKKDKRIDTSNPDPNRWVKEDISRSQNVLNNTSNVIRETQKLQKTAREKKRLNTDLSEMTDADLRNAIERKRLEMQYEDLMSQGNTTKGRQTVDTILDYSSSLLALGSSALGLALAIKELRG